VNVVVFFAGLVVKVCHYRHNKVGPLEKCIGIFIKMDAIWKQHDVFGVNFIVDW